MTEHPTQVELREAIREIEKWARDRSGPEALYYGEGGLHKTQYEEADAVARDVFESVADRLSKALTPADTSQEAEARCPKCDSTNPEVCKAGDRNADHRCCEHPFHTGYELFHTRLHSQPNDPERCPLCQSDDPGVCCYGREPHPHGNPPKSSLSSCCPDRFHSQPNDPAEGLPDDLKRVLRDPSIVVSQDAAVFEQIAKWQKAPSGTASADFPQPNDRESSSTEGGPGEESSKLCENCGYYFTPGVCPCRCGFRTAEQGETDAILKRAASLKKPPNPVTDEAAPEREGRVWTLNGAWSVRRVDGVYEGRMNVVEEGPALEPDESVTVIPLSDHEAAMERQVVRSGENWMEQVAQARSALARVEAERDEALAQIERTYAELARVEAAGDALAEALDAHYEAAQRGENENLMALWDAVEDARDRWNRTRKGSE